MPLTYPKTKRVQSTSNSYTRLYNGVSQQPAAVRLTSQHEFQKNVLNSVVGNLEKRPGTQLIKQVETGFNAAYVGQDVYVHQIVRDTTEKYIVVFTPSATEPILIYRQSDGFKMTVNYDTGADKTYCIHQPSSTANEIRAVTIADTTVIANRGTTPAMDATLTSDKKPFAYIWVKKSAIVLGATNLEIDVDIDGTSSIATYTQQNTTDVAAALITNLTAAFVNMTFTVVGTTNKASVVRAERTSDSNDFTIAVNDSQGNAAVTAIKDGVGKIADLPPVGDDDDILAITSNRAASSGWFYVKYKNDDNQWKETLAEGIKYQLDNTTLPRKLVRGSGDTFDVSKITWENREVGDETTAPEPGFVGQQIQDVFFFKNRLGFLAYENVILSAAGDFFNFFPTTVSEILDDDPIELEQPAHEVNILRDALPFYETLLVFSDSRQFAVTSSKSLLTPKTAVMNGTTAFEFSAKAQAVRAGSNAYFAVESEAFSTIREYFVEPDTLNNDAADITAHVPKYLPIDIKQFISNSNEEILFALSYASGHKDRLYCYSYYWQGEEKILSAWNYWEFGENREILGGYFFGSDLVLLFRDVNDDATVDLVLEKILFREEQSASLGVLLHGDRLIDPAVHTVSAVKSGSPPNEITTITIPINDNFDRTTGLDEWVAVHKTTGQVWPVTRDDTDDEIILSGDFVATKDNYFYLKLYEMKTELTKFLRRNREGIGIRTGRVILLQIHLSIVGTGPFSVVVTPENRSSYTKEYTGVIVGVADLDNPLSVVKSEIFPVTVGGNANTTKVELVSESPYPFQLEEITYDSNRYSSARIGF